MKLLFAVAMAFGCANAAAAQPNFIVILADEVGAKFPVANPNYDPAKPSGRESKRPSAQAGKK
jgi:hypothetical protein